MLIYSLVAICRLTLMYRFVTNIQCILVYLKFLKILSKYHEIYSNQIQFSFDFTTASKFKSVESEHVYTSKHILLQAKCIKMMIISYLGKNNTVISANFSI